MRRAMTAAFAVCIFAVSVAAAPLASAAPAQDPAPPVEEVNGALGLVADVTAEVLAAVSSDDPDAPQDAPAPSSDTQATSASRRTAADLGSAPAQHSGAASPGGMSSPRVPDVPVGSTLQLGSLALPSFDLGATPAVTGKQLAANAKGRVLPASAASLPHASKTTAVAMALIVLLLAGGLLIDQVRKARMPIRL